MFDFIQCGLCCVSHSMTVKCISLFSVCQLTVPHHGMHYPEIALTVVISHPRIGGSECGKMRDLTNKLTQCRLSQEGVQEQLLREAEGFMLPVTLSEETQ